MNLAEVEGVVGRLYLMVLELQKQNAQLAGILKEIEGAGTDTSPQEE